MKVNRVLAFFVVFLSSSSWLTNADEYNIKRLRGFLLDKKRYDKLTRPVKSHNSQTIVKLYFGLMSILDLDITKQQLSMDGRLHLSWRDEHLTWNPDDYGGLKTVKFDFDELWTPEVFIWNYGFTNKDSFSKPSIVVNASGYAWTGISDVITTHCALDLTQFPFDKQTCELYFSSWTYTGEKLNITYYSQTRKRCSYGPVFVNHEYNVNNLTCKRYEMKGKYQTHVYIKVAIEISRQIASYKYYILIPYILATIFTITLFLLPINSNHRFIFGGLAVLILTVILIYLANYLGFRSLGIPYAVRAISLSLLLVIICLVITTLVSQLIIKTGQFFPLLPRFFILAFNNPIVTRILFVSDDDDMNSTQNGKNKSTELEPISEEEEEAENKAPTKDWIIIAKIADRLLFIVYLITIIAYRV